MKHPFRTSAPWTVAIISFIALLVLCYAQFQLPPRAAEIMAQMDLTHSQFSSIASAPMIPSVLFGLVLGMILDRFGIKPVITVGLLLSLLGLYLRLRATDYLSLLIAATLAGMAPSFLNTASSKIAARWFPPEKTVTMLGFILAGSSIGMALGVNTAAMFPSLQSAFLFAVAIGAAALLLWLLGIHDRPAPRSSSGVTQAAGPGASVFRNRSVWVVSLSFFFANACHMAVTTFAPLCMEQMLGLSAVTAGQCSSLYSFGFIIGCLAGPHYYRRLARPRLVCVSLCLPVAAITMLWCLIPSLPVQCVLLFLSGVATSALVPIFIGIPTSAGGVTVAQAGTAGGMVTTFQLMGAVVVPPYVISPIAGDDYPLMFLLAGLCILTAALLSLLLPAQLPPER